MSMRRRSSNRYKKREHIKFAIKISKGFYLSMIEKAKKWPAVSYFAIKPSDFDPLSYIIEYGASLPTYY